MKIKKRLYIPMILVGLFFFTGESFAAGNGSKTKLKVGAKVNKEEDSKEDIKVSSSGTESTTTTETETETCTLKVKIKQSGDPLSPSQLEWYFLSENKKKAKDKDTVIIFSRGRKKLSLKDSVWQEETITSEPFVFTTVSKDSGNSTDKLSGDTYKGYIVLVTQGGEILAKASNSTRWLKDEWIKKYK